MIGSIQVDAFLRALVKFGQDEGTTIRAMVWFVGDPRMYRQDIPLNLSLFGPEGIGDPGLGSGPVRYEDIETIVLSCETNTKAIAFPSGAPRCVEVMAALASRLPADKSIEVQHDRITWRRSPAGESLAERAPTKYAHVVRVDAKNFRVIISRIDDEKKESPLASFDMPGPIEDASRAANSWHQAFFALAHGIGETILFDSPEAKQLYGDSL